MDIIEEKFNLIETQLRNYSNSLSTIDSRQKIFKILYKFHDLVSNITLTDTEYPQIADSKEQAELLLKVTFMKNFDKIINYILQERR